MKLIFLVFLGAILAALITLRFQPELIPFSLLSHLPTPNIYVLSPKAEDLVPTIFTVSGFARLPAAVPLKFRVIDSEEDVVWLSSSESDSKIPNEYGRYSHRIDLSEAVRKGEKINLDVYLSDSDLVSLPLTIK